METYKASHLRLLKELKDKSWTVKDNLKIPYASNGKYRLWFKKEAIYFGCSSSINDARSMFVDSRGMTVETLIARAERWWE